MIQKLALNLKPTSPASFATRRPGTDVETSFADTLGRLEGDASRTGHTGRKVQPAQEHAIDPAKREADRSQTKRHETAEDKAQRPSRKDDPPPNPAASSEENRDENHSQTKQTGPAEARAVVVTAQPEASAASESEDQDADVDQAAGDEDPQQVQPSAEALVAAASVVQPATQPITEQASSGQDKQDKPVQLETQPAKGEAKPDPAAARPAAPDPTLVSHPGAAGQDSPADTHDDGHGDHKSAEQQAQAHIAEGDKPASPQPGTPAQVSAATTPSQDNGGAGSALPQGFTPVAGQALAPEKTDSDAGGDGSQRINEARLARGLASAVNQRGGSLTLRLTPPQMGTVRIQLQLSGGAVNAQFHAETTSAHTLLTQQLADLRNVLEGHGLTVEKLTVQPMNHGQFSGQAGDRGDGSSNNDGHSRGQYARDDGGSRRDRQQQQQQQNRPGSFDQWFSRQTVATSEGV